VRLLTSFPGFATIEDVSSDGRALVELPHGGEWGVVGLLPGDPRERNLSWLDRPTAQGVSRDGRVIVGTESGDGLKGRHAVYLRTTDGASQPVPLGDGLALALSPDSKWVLSRRQDKESELVLLPTGPGEARSLPSAGIEYPNPVYGSANAWSADGRRILVLGSQDKRPLRSFVMDLEGRTTAVTPEGIVAEAISPDGARVAAIDPAGRILLYPVAGGAPQEPPGPPEKGGILTWSSDGRSLFVTEVNGVAMSFFRRDIATGRRELIKELVVADPAGILFVRPLISADGRTFVYNYTRGMSDLNLLDGLK
jgi:hypothetical protein